MLFDACNSYFVVNIKRWSCVHNFTCIFGFSTFTR